jgi:hypothetical protein
MTALANQSQKQKKGIISTVESFKIYIFGLKGHSNNT